MPIFAPVEVEGQLLADGGFSSNTPLDLVLDEPGSDEVLCFVAELFAPRRTAGLRRAKDRGKAA